IARDSANISVGVVPFYSESLGRNVIGITLGRNIVLGTSAGSQAAEAGVAPGDSVLGVNGLGLVNEAELDAALAAATSDAPAVVSMLRDGESYEVEFDGPGLNSASLGLNLRWAPSSRIETRGISLGTAALASAEYIVSMPAMIVASLPIMREDPSLAFVGPIGAGQLTVEAVKIFGPSNLLFIAGLISLGIALFNLIPVPPLDGGGMLVAVVEAARRGKRLSERSVRLAYAIGTSLLITLVILITTSDVLRLIQGRGFGL
ncbi:MAG: site-2 protease family protein, partial [Dehalococcoidia bacterium]|nr:site-2 protease family protein [Dehalococcoidia bacterium]